MADIEVRIVRLEPMRVLSFHAFSKSPEIDGWKKMEAWSKTKELLKDPEKHPVYGFNNPDPSPDKKEYGYEYWIKVEPDFETDEVVVKDFPGGLYAVTKCIPGDDMKTEFFKKEGYLITWKKLRDWVKYSKYGIGKSPFLEHHLDCNVPEEQLVFDLYFPIEVRDKG